MTINDLFFESTKNRQYCAFISYFYLTQQVKSYDIWRFQINAGLAWLSVSILTPISAWRISKVGFWTDLF